MNEKQNTFNTLANKPLLGTSIWCRFGIHNWEKWGEPKTLGESYFEKKYHQQRFCANCHILDFRRFKA